MPRACITAIFMMLFPALVFAGCGGGGSSDDDSTTTDNPPVIENLYVTVDAGNSINIHADVYDDDYIRHIRPFVSKYDTANDRYNLWMFGPPIGPGTAAYSYYGRYSGDFMTVCDSSGCNYSATNMRVEHNGDIFITGECFDGFTTFGCYAVTSYESSVDVYEIKDLDFNSVSIDTFYPVRLYLTSPDPSGVVKSYTSAPGISDTELGFGSTVLPGGSYYGGIEARDSAEQSNFAVYPFDY
ncbi:MAG: hypothetical protein R6V10_03230 [bacterium]